MDAETAHPAADGLLRTSWLLYDSRMTEEGPADGSRTRTSWPGRLRTGPALTLPQVLGCQALPAFRSRRGAGYQRCDRPGVEDRLQGTRQVGLRSASYSTRVGPTAEGLAVIRGASANGPYPFGGRGRDDRFPAEPIREARSRRRPACAAGRTVSERHVFRRYATFPLADSALSTLASSRKSTRR